MSTTTEEEEESNFGLSALGTKAHWDSQYQRELKNFHDTNDIGEVWYGEGSLERVVRWIERKGFSEADTAFLDLGCGNGATLIALSEIGFTDLVGVDYSQAAIELATAVAEKEEYSIKYEVADLLKDPLDSGQPACLGRQHDICIDKGTYDAISLDHDAPLSKRKAYRSTVHKLTKTGGLFLLTSANWTADELGKFFEGNGFSVDCVIPTPKFQFGGSEGTSATVIVLKKED